MRDYSKVSGSFWTGKTGKSLRGDIETQLTALYLMTSPHSNMIGVFYCPIGYIHLDTGLSIEGATKGLQSLCEGGYCTYDYETDTVFVHEMAKYQIGDSLKAADNRVKDIQKQYDSISQSLIKQGFFNKYSEAFCLEDSEITVSPLEAPTKPETGTGTETELKPKTLVRSAPSRFAEFWDAYPKTSRKVGKTACQKKWKARNLDAIADQIISHVKSMAVTKTWLDGFEPAPLTYINQSRWDDEIITTSTSEYKSIWFLTATGIEAKGAELNLPVGKDEIFPDYRLRVFKAAGLSPEEFRKAKVDSEARK